MFFGSKELRNIICKSGFIYLEGTLILTDKEIQFINAQTIQNNPPYLPAEHGAAKDHEILSFRAADELPSVTIPLESIESVKAEKSSGRPCITIRWQKDAGDRKTQFVQKEDWLGSDDINNWPGLIESNKRLRISQLQNSDSSINSLDSKHLESLVLEVLNEKEWKGTFEIVEDIENRDGTKFDFDEIDDVCADMAARKLIEVDSSGGFYRKLPKVENSVH